MNWNGLPESGELGFTMSHEWVFHQVVCQQDVGFSIF